jgi:hypothetical protein
MCEASFGKRYISLATLSRSFILSRVIIRRVVISMIKGDTADRLSLGPRDRLATLIAVSVNLMPEQLFGLADRIFANAGKDIIQGASNDSK